MNIQYPPDCHQARLLVSDVHYRSCGFGCFAHTVVGHLIAALQANRTLVLLSKGWDYAPEGWEYIFLPLSNCTYKGNVKELVKYDETSLGRTRRVVKIQLVLTQ